MYRRSLYLPLFQIQDSSKKYFKNIIIIFNHNHKIKRVNYSKPNKIAFLLRGGTNMTFTTTLRM